MALLCYNRGCGDRYDEDKNSDDACLYHPGVPIFHDALKGWSCCKKRTTDFSEFLSIQGCARGRHSNVKPEEPLRPEVTSDKGEQKQHSSNEIIYQGPKSAEKLQKERPSSDEPKSKLKVKVSPSLTQILEKMEITEREKKQQIESKGFIVGTKCKNSGCKTLYQGPKTDAEICTHHPGAPVFHEGYKYWSCCCIKTIDFNAFLDQKGCTTGKHCWIPKQDKKKVACRHDWHQTGNQVVVTIYAKNASPENSYVEANRTVLTCHIQFENDKVFHKDIHLWGVVDVNSSFVNMVPSKVEVTLKKMDSVAWGKLEDPHHKPEPEVIDDITTEEPDEKPDWYISDDDISESDWEDSDDEEKKKDENESGKKSEKKSEQSSEKSEKIQQTSEKKSEKNQQTSEKKSEKIQQTSEKKSEKIQQTCEKKSEKIQQTSEKKSEKKIQQTSEKKREEEEEEESDMPELEEAMDVPPEKNNDQFRSK